MVMFFRDNSVVSVVSVYCQWMRRNVTVMIGNDAECDEANVSDAGSARK